MKNEIKDGNQEDFEADTSAFKKLFCVQGLSFYQSGSDLPFISMLEMPRIQGPCLLQCSY